MESTFGSYALVLNEDFNWSFIPWPFAMWSPFVSRVCSFSIVTKDWHFSWSFFLGSLPFSVSFTEWELVMSSYTLYGVVLRLGTSRVECSSLPHSLLMLSPLRVQLPEWSVQPFVAVSWGELISVYSHTGVQFPADSDGFFGDCVDMCRFLEVLLDTLLYSLLTDGLPYLCPGPFF